LAGSTPLLVTDFEVFSSSFSRPQVRMNAVLRAKIASLKTFTPDGFLIEHFP
jgi:hypothetical protein